MKKLDVVACAVLLVSAFCIGQLIGCVIKRRQSAPTAEQPKLFGKTNDLVTTNNATARAYSTNEWPFDEELTKDLERVAKQLNPTNDSSFTNYFFTNDTFELNVHPFVGYTNFLTLSSNRVVLKVGPTYLYRFTDQEWALLQKYYDPVTPSMETQFWGPTNRTSK